LLIAIAVGCGVLVSGGCDSVDPIVTYRVPTKLPEELQQSESEQSSSRMLAAMVPSGDQVWFFKVTGPESAVGLIESDFRDFVENISFADGSPRLDSLPSDWKRSGEKPMRFASIDVDTPDKQLDISVSNLARQDDYDAFVAMNVNRWRGQLSLGDSADKWADGEPINVAAADGPSVWVDLVGTGGGGSPMTPPFANGAGPFAGGGAPFASGGSTPPSVPPTVTPPNSPAPSSNFSPTSDAETGPADSRLSFDTPDGWRPGRMSTMRMAAFDVGPEDATAEITVIPAGGDLRGNVARWIGQVRGDVPPDDVVDAAMDAGTEVDVDGRPGKRFFLTGDDAKSDEKDATAIDATIVSMDGGMSLFIKMTGPTKTVAQQSDSIVEFLASLKLKL
jgi:hypothetical protein